MSFRLLSRVSGLFATVLLFSALASATATAAEVTTEAATEITPTSAQLNATLSPEGAGMFYAFEYGLTEESKKFTKYGVIGKRTKRSHSSQRRGH